MFTCTKWVESSNGKSCVGKKIVAIILQDKDFLPRCEHIVKVSEPLVRVLIADNEEKPSMGYLYETMDKAKEEIKTRLKNRVSQYGPYIRAIDARWDKFVPDCDIQDIISGQLEEYKKATGDFGMPLAIRQRERLNPVAWWKQFRNDTQELQKFEIRALS
uniref:HAT C-terminal dimerisation domain-containing protein n=1 Tax=Salix viminalis TaxID=40686 RepID=A0A6N2KY54_SALVM